MRGLVLVALMMAVLLVGCRQETIPPTVEIIPDEAGSFIINVSGDAGRDFSGEGMYADLGDQGIVLTLNDVQIALPAGIEPGTYDLISYIEAFDEDGGVTTAGANYTELGIIYGSISAGSITLQTINPMTGNFTFTATNEQNKTVTVNGVMNQIPAMEQG